MAPKKTARTTRSRAETKEQFDEIVTAHAMGTPVDAKNAEADKYRADFIRQSVQGISVEGVLKAVADIKLVSASALDAVTAQLAAKVEELANVNEALALAKTELKEVHSLDVAVTSLDLLLAEYQEKETTLETEQLKTEAAWAEDQRAHAAINRLRDQDTVIARRREQEEYDYKTQQARRAAEDQFQNQLQAKQRQEEVRQEELGKTWLAREQALASTETEVQNLRVTIAAHPELLRKEKEAAVAIATNSLKKDLTHEFALKEKDLQTKLSIESSSHAQVKESLAKQEQVVKELQTRIVELQQKVVEISGKAIDGAAKADAFNQFIQTTRDQNGGSASQKSRA